MLQCEVIGNLGNDAEIKYFSGKKYVSFSVAHSEVSKDQQGLFYGFGYDAGQRCLSVN